MGEDEGLQGCATDRPTRLATQATWTWPLKGVIMEKALDMGSSSKQTTSHAADGPLRPGAAVPSAVAQLAGMLRRNTYNGTGVAPLDALSRRARTTAIANANTGALGNLGNRRDRQRRQDPRQWGLVSAADGRGKRDWLGADGFNSAMGSAQSALKPVCLGTVPQSAEPVSAKGRRHVHAGRGERH
jgi:hypothetical protein